MSAPLELKLKDTLNLPKTAFPMKANLAQNEPKRLEKWKSLGIIRTHSRGPRRAPRNTSCMTGRRTPTAPSISVMRSISV